ncbi:MAG: carboxymuconolactone decarboxylase family protein [Pseudomonadota bacterium]
MATRTLVTDDEASPEVLSVFKDIRKTRGSDFINNFWRALAHDPAQLKRIWEELKLVMGPGALDPVTKEMIYIAVSTANGCEYCIHSHTAAAKTKGMTPDQHNELLSIIGMAGKTNSLATSLQVPVDPEFEV